MLTSTYWPAWKAAVQEGKAKGVMCSCESALTAVPSVPFAALSICPDCVCPDGFRSVTNAVAIADNALNGVPTVR